MCNFVPGQVVCIGPKHLLGDLGEGLPGIIERRPLVSDSDGIDPETPMAELQIAILNTDPGVELFGLSKMSAALSEAIRANKAVVDLNHYLPVSALPNSKSDPFRLSPFAQTQVESIRRFLRSSLTVPPATVVAVLDSGLSTEVSLHREIRFLDYSSGGRLNRDGTQSDPVGHGTRVAKILDEILPPDVGLVVGRLPSDGGALTALTVAQAYGDIVARSAPAVLNLSVAPRDDFFLCPHCRRVVPTPTFFSALLPMMMRLAGKTITRTITVMAAGNSGQVANSRWLSEDLDTLLLAVAENRRGERASYSSAPAGPWADLYSVPAFGGDDPDDEDRQGVFVDGSYGTSFAAPFISAVALFSKQFDDGPLHNTPTRLGLYTRDFMMGARQGLALRMRQPTNGMN